MVGLVHYDIKGPVPLVEESHGLFSFYTAADTDADRYRHDADNNTDVGRSRNAASTLILHKFFILGYNINISLSGDEVQ